MLGCRHLLSHNQNGIEIQTYCAIIACLVIALGTGRQPTKRTHEMLCFHMMGWATTDEVEAQLAKLKLADAQAAQKRGWAHEARLQSPRFEPLHAAHSATRSRWPPTKLAVHAPIALAIKPTR